MALFQKQTKSRLSAAKGPLQFEKFTTPVSVGCQKAFVVELTDADDGRKYSICMYGREVDELREQVNGEWPKE